MTAPALAALRPPGRARRDHSHREVPRGPAPWWLRSLAGLLDLGVAALPAALGLLIVHSLREANGGGQADRLVFGAAAAAAALWVFVWNFGYAQGRTGASAGKRWCGLTARDAATGAPLGVRRALAHQLARLLDLATVAGALRPLWRADGATLSDRLLGVQVVRRATALDEGFDPQSRPPGVRATRLRRLAGLAALAALLAVVLLASVAVGARPMTLAEIAHAVLPPYTESGADTDIIVRSLRVPRALVGLCVGAALGVAGALIQGHTRNPLADPGILGVSAGASFAVVMAIFVLGVTTPLGYVWFAFAGALVASVAVFGLAAVGGGTASPLSLVLGGSAVAAFLGSVTSAVVLLDQSTLDSFRFWVVGSVAGRGLDVLWPVLPFLVLGLLVALASAPGLNLLALGEDVARGLGANVAANRAAGVAAITLLTGAATAVAGPVGFVGLVVPHLARALTGPDYRWLVPASGLVGAILLVLCDVVGRVVARPGELQVGLVLALVGAPFFVALVRRRTLVTL